MELSWITKIKLAVVLGIGILLLGHLAWPLVRPVDPMGLVATSNLSFAGALLLMVLAYTAGFLAYFAAWPYGREAAILAVPAGLGLWGLKSGTMTTAMQMAQTVESRQAVYASLRWDAFYWLLLVGVGVLGMLTATRFRTSTAPQIPEIHHETHCGNLPRVLAAILLSLIITFLLVGIFAQSPPLPHSGVAGQTQASQIAFAIWMAFGTAAFIVRHLFGISYGWTIGSVALLYIVTTTAYARTQLLTDLCSYIPATCFSHALMGILPVQLVAFGTLGAVTGYWLAVRYHFWRRHEIT